MGRIFQPGGGGHHSFRPPSAASSGGGRSEPRSVAPQVARGLWRAVCDAATDAAAQPEASPQALVLALKALGKVSFPLPAGDIRAEIAGGVLRVLRAYAHCEAAMNRRPAAPLVGAGAAWLRDILIEQGAALAQAGNARIDPSERGDD